MLQPEPWRAFISGHSTNKPSLSVWCECGCNPRLGAVGFKNEHSVSSVLGNHRESGEMDVIQIGIFTTWWKAVSEMKDGESGLQSR